MLLAFGAAIWGKLLLALAEGYIREVYPAIHARIGADSGILPSFSSDERRVRRRLAGGLLFGEIDRGLAGDEKIAFLQKRWRLAAGLIAVGFLAVGVGFSM
jgi:hypothetical protein